jgi:lipopolysaccharide/colanic/teichoic acid biosynthesis glycosyltransferase
MRRSADIVFSVFLLVVLSPVLVLTTLAILIDSPGNPFYVGVRIGKDGSRFRMWKFRTMITGADLVGGSITAPQDSRITRLGRLLRATKIDELPQLINLLSGDLTIVGPRPETPNLVALYTPEQRETLHVKPGITGPGQLYYTTDQANTIPAGVDPERYYVEHLLGDKLRLDLEYLKTRTGWTDCKVLFQTFSYVGRAVTAALRRAEAELA